jgi:hypothetical protein
MDITSSGGAANMQSTLRALEFFIHDQRAYVISTPILP